MKKMKGLYPNSFQKVLIERYGGNVKRVEMNELLQ